MGIHVIKKEHGQSTDMIHGCTVLDMGWYDMAGVIVFLDGWASDG
jgi:hypothetical protein